MYKVTPQGEDRNMCMGAVESVKLEYLSTCADLPLEEFRLEFCTRQPYNQEPGHFRHGSWI